MSEKLFALKANGTTPRTEIVSGITIFFTTSACPLRRSKIRSAAGMDQGAVFVATCLAAAITTW